MLSSFILKPKWPAASILCFQNLQNSISQLEKLEIGRNLVNFSNQDHLFPICALADFFENLTFTSTMYFISKKSLQVLQGFMMGLSETNLVDDIFFWIILWGHEQQTEGRGS